MAVTRTALSRTHQAAATAVMAPTLRPRWRRRLIESMLNE
jgi:hypothetical protein